MADIRKNIAANITKHRKLMKLSQKELADTIGVKSFTTVSTWERGGNVPDVETLFKLCTLFNISVDEMYGANTLAKEVKEIGAIQSYLEELGYIVKPSSIPLSSHNEEMIDSDGEDLGDSTVVDEEIPLWNISGNGLCVTISDEDFQRLKSSSADLINAFLWQKSQENK